MLPRLQVFHAWCHHLETLLPAVRITQLRVMALFVLGITWTRTVSLPQVATALPLGVHPASTERRLRRWLGNERFDREACWSAIRRSLLARYAGEEIVMVYDPSPLGKTRNLLCFGIVHGHRVLPLAWAITPLEAAGPAPQMATVRPLALRLAADLPADCVVTVLADRGFVGPGLVDVCQACGWHLVLRLRSSATDTTRIRLPDGTETTLAPLLTRPGQRWHSPVQIFKKAGWRAGWVTIHWGRGSPEPWVLFSTRPGGVARVREYRKRFRVEATYQDLKGRGFQIERTRLQQTERIDRLLMLVILAFWWLIDLGDRVVKRGRRRQWDRANRVTKSRLALGILLLEWYEHRQAIPPLLLPSPLIHPAGGIPTESVRK